RGAHVILTARDLPKGEAVAAGIRESTGNPKVEVAELEFGSLQQIRAFADRFLARHPALHIMVGNAGVMACPPMKRPTASSSSSARTTSATSSRRASWCRRCAPPRRAAWCRSARAGIACRRSSSEDIQFERRPYDKWQSYGQAKT